MDYQALLYGPTYGILGVPAQLRIGDTDYPVRAVDKTAGIVIGGGVDVQTVLPAAVIRASELIAQGLAVDQLDHQQFIMNGKVWHISSTRPKPSPRGEDDGEVYLILEGDE